MPIVSPNNSNFTAITATSGDAPLLVTFQVGDNRGFYPISDSWNYGDSGTASATDTGSGQYTISHTYTVPGVYSVTLTGTHSSGSPNPSTFTQTNYITVTGDPPVTYGGGSFSGVNMRGLRIGKPAA